MDTTISRLPRRTATSLESWTAHDWRHGIFLRDLKPHDRVIIRTRNSTYEIIVLVPETASVLVRGGMFFPDFTPARVAGSSLGGGLLKMHSVFTGFHMELLADRWILTTQVQTVSVLTPAIGPVM
jgi:hypothetical protein